VKVRLIGLLLASSQNSMGNAVQLFGQEKIDGPLDLDTIVTLSVTDILASHAELAYAIKELSEYLDALAQITRALSDSPARTRYQQMARKSRENLTNAMLDLSRGVLPNLQ
jgi:hypothetical protein